MMRPRPRGPEVFSCTMRPLDKLSLGRSAPDQYCGSKMIFSDFDPDPTFKIISDPDPDLDPASDPA
jgi:hypothetical protein